jgi:hypothetical protein
VIITDGNDIVLRLLEKNRDHLAQEEDGGSNVLVRKLLWGLRDQVESLAVSSFARLETATTAGIAEEADSNIIPDIIIGEFNDIRVSFVS